MAKVVLPKHFFCGFRIRKSPDPESPVWVPDEFVQFLPEGSVVVAGPDGDLPEVGQTIVTLSDFDLTGPSIVDLDEKLEAHEKDALFAAISLVTASAQQLMTKFGLTADQVTGTGKDGRITRRDVLDARG